MVCVWCNRQGFSSGLSISMPDVGSIQIGRRARSSRPVCFHDAEGIALAPIRYRRSIACSWNSSLIAGRTLISIAGTKEKVPASKLDAGFGKRRQGRRVLVLVGYPDMTAHLVD